MRGAALGVVSVARATRVRWPVVWATGAAVAILLLTVAIADIPYVAGQQARDRLRCSPGSTTWRRVRTVSTVWCSRAPPRCSRSARVPVFNVWNAHYANPFAQFADRSRFLARVASERDAVRRCCGAAPQPLRPRPRVVMLDREGAALTYTDYQDAFPVARGCGSCTSTRRSSARSGSPRAPATATSSSWRRRPTRCAPSTLRNGRSSAATSRVTSLRRPEWADDQRHD